MKLCLSITLKNTRQSIAIDTWRSIGACQGVNRLKITHYKEKKLLFYQDNENDGKNIQFIIRIASALTVFTRFASQ